MDLGCVRFSLDEACYAITKGSEFWVYNSDPHALIKRCDVGGTLRFAQLLGRTNIVFLVGGGKDPLDSPNVVCVWDDVKGKIVFRLEMKSQVLNILAKNDRLVIVMAQSVAVYDFPGDPFPKLISEYETCENIEGLAALSSSPQRNILVMRHTKSTDAFVCDIGHDALSAPATTTPTSATQTTASSSSTSTSAATRQGDMICTCCRSDIVQLAVTADGSMLASTSSKGTLVRVYETKTGMLAYEFRRSYLPTHLHSLRFSRDGSFICIASDRTIHLFRVAFENYSRGRGSVRSKSFGTFETKTQCLCSFLRSGTKLLAITQDAKAQVIKVDASLGKEVDERDVYPLCRESRASVFRVDVEKWKRAHFGTDESQQQPPQEPMKA